MQIIFLQKRGDFIKVFTKALILIMVSLFLCMPVYATNKGVSWYCKRTKDHSQPTIGSDLSFSEKYNLFWCDKNVSNDDKVIYLTFDAGYENGNVKKIVDILKEENVTGAFFILDNLLNKNEELVMEMVANGNIVANHTSKHKDITKFSSKEEMLAEIKRLEDLFESKCGSCMPKYFRPPEGKINEESLKWLDEMGYKTVMWSFAYDDWDNGRQPSKEIAIKKIFDNVHNGEVMLLHPTSKTNTEILREVIRELKNQGYRFGTLSELCETN